MRRVVLFGASHGFAIKTIRAINEEAPTWEIIGFLDDDPAKAGGSLLGFPILGDRSLIPELAADADTWFFNNVMGHWTRRRDVADLLEGHGCRIASLIDPRIDVYDLHHGRGVFIGAFANFGHSVHLGDHAVVMQAVVLGDETRIGDRVFLANLCNVGSRAVVGDDAFVGPNSVTLIDRRLGERCVIGAGATVTKNVPDDARAMGAAAVITQ